MAPVGESEERESPLIATSGTAGSTPTTVASLGAPGVGFVRGSAARRGSLGSVGEARRVAAGGVTGFVRGDSARRGRVVAGFVRGSAAGAAGFVRRTGGWVRSAADLWSTGLSRSDRKLSFQNHHRIRDGSC